MGLFFALLAALFASTSNFFMRRSIDAGGTTKGFVLIQMSIAGLVAVLLGPVQSNSYAINGSVVGLGVLAGVFLVTMLYILGKALLAGPPGLTFSILTAAAVVPAIVMASLFGAAFGFLYTAWHGIGSLLVLAGLFWAGQSTAGGLQDLKRWTVLVISMFSLHVLLLVLFQYRAVLINTGNLEAQSSWFMPVYYFAAAAIQLGIFFRTEARALRPREWLYGCIGGAANSLCTFFLLRSTEVAKGLENAVIFPAFSIGIILLSNLWGQKVYQEKVNWRAAQVCACGLIVGTVDWSALMAAVGF
jgi:hypothetical protein